MTNDHFPLKTKIMNNRINKLFQEKKEKILSVYFTAGYPNPEDTVPMIQALVANGVDLIEIGMPFSDPVADGPTIQRAASRALKNKYSIADFLQAVIFECNFIIKFHPLGIVCLWQLTQQKSTV